MITVLRTWVLLCNIFLCGYPFISFTPTQINVEVVASLRQRFQFKLAPTTTIESVKRAVERTSGIPIHLQKMIVHGAPAMNPERTVASYGAVNNSWFALILPPSFQTKQQVSAELSNGLRPGVRVRTTASLKLKNGQSVSYGTKAVVIAASRHPGTVIVRTDEGPCYRGKT